MNELCEFVGASVSLELKTWLEETKARLDLSMAQIVRRALVAYRETIDNPESGKLKEGEK